MSDMEEPDYQDILTPDDVTFPEPPVFPQAGRDLTPTVERIEQGKVGNGSWDITGGAVQLAYEQHAQEVREAKDERAKFFDEKAKDGLVDAIDLHHRIIKQGQKVMDKIETGGDDVFITNADLNLLAKAQKSAVELTDRAAGKSRQTSNHTETRTSIEYLIAGKGE